MMNWTELWQNILITSLPPLLTTLVGFLVAFLNKKKRELQLKIDNELFAKYEGMFFETINNCVIATNQEYVETLKRLGKFDKEAQQEAFIRTKTAVLALLSTDAKKYLAEIYGDLELFIDKFILTSVNSNKITIESEVKNIIE